MIIGSAHTEDVAKMLAAAGRPYAVVTPLALQRRDHAGDLGTGFDRRYQKKSVFTTGFLTSVLEPMMKKPEPVLNERWFQAKADAYWLVDQVTHRVLGSGGGPPPYGLRANELHLPFASVNPTAIAGPAGGGSGGGGDSVVFPLVLNPDDEARRTTIWVKAARRASQGLPGTVEALLRRP